MVSFVFLTKILCHMNKQVYFEANCFSDADHNKTDLSVDTHIDNDSPYISADAIVNATLGKNIALTCTVHNLKNYKVRKLNNFMNIVQQYLIPSLVKYEQAYNFDHRLFFAYINKICSLSM